MKPAAFKLLSLLVLAVFASAARAQLQSTFNETPIPAAPTSNVKRAASIEGVRLGFSGIIPADAWSPIRVYLSGNPLINSGAFGGTLALEFTQDATQSAQIITPIATTPGRVLPVEIIAALPRGTQDLRITLRDDSGRLVHERTYARRGPGGESFPGQIVDGVNLVLILSERDAGTPDFARFLPAPEDLLTFGAASTAERDTPVPAFDRLVRVTSATLDLPSTDFGFDGLFAVFSKSDLLNRLPRAKSEALARWVRSGGCLVVFANPGAQTWTSLFGEPLPFEVLDPASFSPGTSLQAAFAKQPASLLSSISGRALRLTPDAQSRGWRSQWHTEIQPDPATHGLLAQGPVGLGWIVVLGASPDFFTTTLDASRTAWFDALKHALAERDQRPFRHPMNYWRSRGSGQDQSARATIRVILNSLSEIPPLGDGAFLIVACSLLLLAGAIGPFDALFLGAKKRRTISWATALGWIALAAGIAALIPPMIRSGDSLSRRLRVVDVLQAAQQAPQCYQTALTTFFSNSTNTVALVRDTDPISNPHGWFRGVSPVRIDDYNDSRPLTGFTTTQFEVRDAGQVDAAGFRMNQPDSAAPIAMGQWTFRTLMDQQSAASLNSVAPPTVSLDRKDQHWKVKVQNARGKLSSAQLRIGNAWFTLEPTEKADSPQSSDASTELNLHAHLVHQIPGDWIVRSSSASNENSDSVHAPFTPGLATELPGARDRSRSVEALIASGAWACIYIYETNTPPTLLARTRAGRGEAFHSRESTVWRILVPLEPFDREHPAPLLSATPSENPVETKSRSNSDPTGTSP